MARHELTEKLDEIARGGLSVRSAHVCLTPDVEACRDRPVVGEAAHPLSPLIGLLASRRSAYFGLVRTQLHLDLARLRMLGLRDGENEQPVAIQRLHLGRVD